MATYYGRNKTQYVLDRHLGGGGEGEVYTVQGHSDLVAKLYYSSKLKPTSINFNPRVLMKEKIETMLEQPVSAYTKRGVLIVAWPQDILYDDSGQFVGYTMPRVKSRYHIFAASRERERIILYPKYTWKTAVSIAYNLAMAVRSVNSAGVVVGDMNPNNIMVDERGRVTLIDTDSFNITNKRTGKTYKCSVGVPEMLPPELQGVDLADPKNEFTEKTDGFALSIHVFNLLMNNCHPFGVLGMNKSKSSTSNAPVAKQIARGECPYITGGKGKTSPDAPDVAMLPKEIRELFDRAFSYDVTTAVKASTIAKRPSAQEWMTALENLYQSRMITCIKDMKHVYPASYPKCPWCRHSTPGINPSVTNSTQNNLPNPVTSKIVQSKGSSFRINKKLIGTIAVVLFVFVIWFQIQSDTNEQINIIKGNISNNSISCNYTEAGFLFLSTHYCYCTLSFKDDNTLDFYFGYGNVENQKFEGNYSYYITKSLFGEYKLKFAEKSFVLKITSRGELESISYDH